MKVRSSFVTNSSSSSFIVTFDKTPESTEEMQKMLFDGRKEYPSPYGDNYWSTEEIAKIVFGDMGAQATREEIIEELENSVHHSVYMKYDRESPNYPYDQADNEVAIDKYREASRKHWDMVDSECKRLAKEKYAELFEGKSDVYIFSYADENGDLGCAIEHGILFDNVEHIKISNH